MSHVSSQSRLKAVVQACRDLNLSILDGKTVRNEKHPLWARAAKLLQNKISPQTLTSNFRDNYDNLLDDFKWLCGSGMGPVDSAEDLPMDVTSGQAMDMEFVEERDKMDMWFNIVINSEQWKRMEPQEILTKDGTASYWLLGPEFKKVLFNAIWREGNFDCDLGIGGYIVRKGETADGAFIKIDSYCNECQALVTIKAKREEFDADGSITFNVMILGKNNTKHSGKIKCFNDEAVTVEDDVQMAGDSGNIMVIEENDVTEDDEGNVTSQEALTEQPRNEFGMNFQIVIDPEQWKKIQPRQKLKKKNGSSYLILGQEYKEILFNAIRNKIKVDCYFCIRKHYVKKEGEDFITIYGYCNECPAQITIIGNRDKFCAYGAIVFDVRMESENSFKHNRKRKLRIKGEERKRIKALLKHQTVAEVQDKFANEGILYKGSPDSDALTKRFISSLRLESVNDELGIVSDLWKSIENIENNPEVGGKYFRNIGFRKTFVSYWSDHQVEIHNEIQRTAKTSISIDGSSGVVRRLRSNGESSPVLLLNIVSHIDTLIIPLCHMLTEKYEDFFYSYWLGTWLDSGASIPASVVVGRCKGLDHAVCMAFNHCTFATYNEKCLRLILRGASSVGKELKCWVRKDIAHFMQSVTQWDCWKKNRNKDTKHFFLKLIRYMTTISDFSTFVRVAQLIIKVGSAEFDVDDSIVNARDTLNECIESHKLVETEDNNDDGAMDEAKPKKSRRRVETEPNPPDWCAACGNEVGDEETNNTDLMSTFIEFLCRNDEYDSDCSYSEFSKNQFYLPGFVRQFCHLLRYFPAWSRVMQPLFDYHEDFGTAARSYNYFSHVKSELVCGPITNLRLDKFLIGHCKTIDVIIKQAYAVRWKLESQGNSDPLEQEEKQKIRSTIQYWRNNLYKNEVMRTTD